MAVGCLLRQWAAYIVDRDVIIKGREREQAKPPGFFLSSLHSATKCNVRTVHDPSNFVRLQQKMTCPLREETT